MAATDLVRREHYHSYAYPVFMHGLESIVLDKLSIDTLATFHISILKELQGLPALMLLRISWRTSYPFLLYYT